MKGIGRSRFLQGLFIVMLNAIGFAQNDRPNIVWITSEDNSKHYLKLFDEHGAKAPNIEKLAKMGLVFSHAYSNAAVCSAARSTLISGTYGPRLASHYHRKLKATHLPENLQMFPAYLRAAGYYTSNNAKEDYNFVKPSNVWDDSSSEATWKNRNQEQPFFHVFNIHTTHESNMHFSEEEMSESSLRDTSTFIQPNHPQTELFNYSNERYLELMRKMDEQVGQVIKELEDDGLMDNTIIFYFGDHGGVLPGSKGYINEMGVHVPLVVYVPVKYQELIGQKQGSTLDAFVSFVDFGPTVLNLAGINIPEEMDGSPFLGSGVTKKDLRSKNTTFSYADRFDEKYDMVRALRKGKYKYIRNYQPFNADGLMNNYRYKQLGYQEWKNLYNENKLNEVQSRFFRSKAPEELYDLEKDPYETINLADQDNHKKVLVELRSELMIWVKQLPDLSFYPEFYLVKHAMDNPNQFGLEHKNMISSYVDIANLMLVEFEGARDHILKLLKSEDPWKRYWALICCSSFGVEAIDLTAEIKKISLEDVELINRVRAAEFLGLTSQEDPVKIMTEALYNSQDAVEGLLILNSIVLMQDGDLEYDFEIDTVKMSPIVAEYTQVERRLSYLNAK